MRIIAGIHKSRKLATLEGNNTRPMMDVMKESIFNTIGPYLEPIEVLDIFGGSGALTLEAISRGAKHSYISELSKEATKIIETNVKALHEENNVTIMNMDYRQALKRLQGKKFDLVFLDPPYRMNITNDLIKYLVDNDFLNEGAIVVCHYIKGNVEISKDLKMIKQFIRGTAEATIYKKED